MPSRLRIKRQERILRKEEEPQISLGVKSCEPQLVNDSYFLQYPESTRGSSCYGNPSREVSLLLTAAEEFSV